MKNIQTMIRDLVAVGVQQADIARAIGMHHSQISRWAAGRVPRAASASLKLLALHAGARAKIIRSEP